MADIKQTVDAMPIKDLEPTPPSPPTPPPPPVVGVTAIRDVAKALTRPWTFGDNLQRIGQKYGVNLKQVQEIKAAVDARIKEKAVEIVEVL
jgi:hypothetical protein